MYMLPGKILLIEDDESLGFVIQDVLSKGGYDVTHIAEGEQGLNIYKKDTYDLVLLDVMLPKLDGFSIAKEIRSKDNKTPIIFLTAKSLQEDRIKGFNIGADDFITKPFSVEELKLRVNAVLKRTRYNVLKEKEQTQHDIGKYQFDYENQSLKGPESTRKLTRKEADVLQMLCLNMNKILRREDALVTIWGENDYFMGRSMDVYITKLRKMLSEDPSISIKNVHNTGFKLEVQTSA